MSKALAIAWLVLLSVSGFGQDRYLLVLKDGRTIAYEGAFKVEGERVYYTASTGDKLYIPRDKVDLKESQRLRRLAGADGPAPKPKEPSLAEQVEAYKQQAQEREADPDRKTLVYTGEPGSRNTDHSGSRPLDAPPLVAPDMDKLPSQEKAEQWMRDLESRMDPKLFIVFIVWIGLGVLGSLIGFGTWVYVMISSYMASTKWGFGLTVSFFVSMLAGILIPDALGDQVAFGLNLVHHAAVIAYIWERCYGRRALLLSLLYGGTLLLASAGFAAWLLFLRGV